MEDDLHAKAIVAAPGDGLTDAAHADDANGLASDMRAQHLGRVPAGPLASADQSLALRRAAGGHQDQGHGDIGGGIGDGTGGVGDLQAGGAGGGDVDVVVAHPEIGEDLGAGIWHIGKDIGAEEVAQRWQDGVIVAQSRGADRRVAAGWGHRGR